MRIVSLLPGATEMLAALGLEEQLVGISHSCDYPPGVARLPRVTRTGIPADAPSGEIDRLVRELTAGGFPLYTLDRQLLSDLAPDLVVTQGLCDVCAVPDRQAREMATGLPGCPRVVSLAPDSLHGVLADLVTLGAATGCEGNARRLAGELEQRVGSVARRAAMARTRPRVTFLEWVQPLFASGHWTPELVGLAGGIEGHGRAGERSRPLSWSEVQAWAPEVLVVACCGLSAGRAEQEIGVLRDLAGYHDLPAVRAGKVFVVDGGAYFSRPGPRLVESLELLAHLFHPDLFPLAPAPVLTVAR